MANRHEHPYLQTLLHVAACSCDTMKESVDVVCDSIFAECVRSLGWFVLGGGALTRESQPPNTSCSTPCSNIWHIVLKLAANCSEVLQQAKSCTSCQCFHTLSEEFAPQ